MDIIEPRQQQDPEVDIKNVVKHKENNAKNAQLEKEGNNAKNLKKNNYLIVFL